ncbi:MAG: prepilin peptidase, partial [Ilumatobacteraceae bacterium]
QAATSGISGAASVAVVAACSWVGGCAVAAAVVDVECRRVPNRLVLGVLVAGVAASIGLSWVGSARSPAVDRVSGHVGDVVEGLALAFAGCALAGLPMLIVRLIRRIGMGDVKLAGALGASLMVLGWWVPLAAVAIAAAAAAAFGVLANRSAAPLAPFLAAGWCAAIACVPMASGFGQ